MFLRDGQCRVVRVSNYHPGGQGQYAESIENFFTNFLFQDESNAANFYAYDVIARFSRILREQAKNSNILSLWHRVCRVLSFFSSRRNWSSPTLLAAGECALPPRNKGWGAHCALCPPTLCSGEEGHTRLRLKGWGSPNSDERTYTVGLYIPVYKWFMVL